MLEQMIAFSKSWFIYPNLTLDYILTGIGLAIVFGAIWLSMHWLLLFKRHWLWALLVGSAFLSLLAITFVQVLLQYLVGQALGHFWSQGILMS